MRNIFKTILGIFATMAGTQALLFWLGAIDQPLWFIAFMIFSSAGIWCFADEKTTEINNN